MTITTIEFHIDCAPLYAREDELEARWAEYCARSEQLYALTDQVIALKGQVAALMDSMKNEHKELLAKWEGDAASARVGARIRHAIHLNRSPQ